MLNALAASGCCTALVLNHNHKVPQGQVSMPQVILMITTAIELLGKKKKKGSQDWDEDDV